MTAPDNLNYLRYEFVLYWISVSFYILATCSFAYAVFFNKENKLHTGLILSGAGLLPHMVAISLRWYASGHGPYINKFESISSTAWLAVAFFLLISIIVPRLKLIGLFVIPVSFLLLASGIMNTPGIQYLPASFQTIWLIFHILFNKLALGAILTALGCSFFYIKKEQYGNTGILVKLPSLKKLDMYSYNFCGICFIFWTITVIAGSIWAHKSWGRYWAWDPIEIWSLLTWLIFGLYMHLRKFHGLMGRKAAFFMIGCFCMVIATLFIIPFITNTIHTEYLVG